MLEVTEKVQARPGSWERDAWKRLERFWQTLPTSVIAAVPFLLAAVVAGWHLGTKSLWVDEATVAGTILRGDVLKPEYLQTTPVGFAVLVDLMAHMFGPNETSLRLVPYLFGSLAVLLTFVVAQRFFPSRIEPLAAALFAATNLHILAYAENLKPYSADICCPLIIVLLAERVISKSTPGRWIAYTLAITLCPLVSFSSVFTSAVTAAVLIITYLRRRSLSELRCWLLSHMAAAVLVGAYGFFFLRRQRQAGQIVSSWATGFVPDNNLVALMRHDALQTSNVMRFFFFIGPNARLELLAVIGLLVGLVVVYRQHPRFLAYCVGPLAVSAGAGVLQLYPYDASRIMLFALSGFLILVASGLVALARALPGVRGHVAGVILLGLALIPGIRVTHTFAVHPLIDTPASSTEEVRDLVRGRLLPSIEPGDVVYVYYAAAPAFQFYAPAFQDLRLDWGQHDVVTAHGVTVDFGPIHRDKPSEQGLAFVSDLQSLKPRRVWMLFSHDELPEAKKEADILLGTARQCGQITFDEESVGARLIRVDLVGNRCR